MTKSRFKTNPEDMEATRARVLTRLNTLHGEGYDGVDVTFGALAALRAFIAENAQPEQVEGDMQVFAHEFYPGLYLTEGERDALTAAVEFSRANAYQSRLQLLRGRSDISPDFDLADAGKLRGVDSVIRDLKSILEKLGALS